MAEYISFQKDVKVNGTSVMSVINSLKTGQDYREKVLAKYGIKNPLPTSWHLVDDYLKAFKEMANELGGHTVFSIGKAVPENAIFPPEIDSLQKALASIDVAYKMNHDRPTGIGYYKLVEFDDKKRTAVLECYNPYPSEFDRGIITTIVRKFKPKDSFKSDVLLDLTKESRLKGGDRCFFNIYW